MSSSGQTPGDPQRTGFLSELSVVDETDGSSFVDDFTAKEIAYVTPDLRLSDLKSSCRHVASVPVSLPFNRYQNLSSLAGVQRLLANGFNYMWSGNNKIVGLSPDCVLQCSKNATRDYFVSMFRENQDSLDENLCVSLDSCKNNSNRHEDYFSSCLSSCGDAWDTPGDPQRTGFLSESSVDDETDDSSFVDE
ncbi:hypothetical protein QJS10_CPB14g00215 [Acorus calamus]|uniref:Uncharacterized protein n=1 Tax=Acorus calamus TaxID=4465 RepID=A0AAV9D9N8_ACOCL|nr:hypothetical protein QJS10_CPB14g00215 [Acorus calamus]